jgi:hypothetical protein
MRRPGGVVARVAVVIEEDPADGAHYLVSVCRELAGGFEPPAPLASIPRPLACPENLPAALGNGHGNDLGAITRRLLAQPSPDVATLRRIGSHLWDLVFTADVHRAWEEIAADGTVLDIRASDLKRLPWEILQHRHRAMFVDPGHPFAVGCIDAPPRSPLALPLRVLVVIGDPSQGTLRWEDEVTALEVLGARYPDRFHVEVLTAPDLTQLHKVCGQLQPHVLHVIAHGVLLNGTPALEIRADLPWDLNPQHVVDFLPRALSLVVLNACHTGDANAEELLTLCEALRENGAQATVAMQGPVDNLAAARFSAHLYAALLDGESLDTACARAREAISTEFPHTVDRWLPTLQLAAAPGPLLPGPAVTEPPEPRDLVDRSVERRQILFALDPPDDLTLHAQRRELVLVQGSAAVGKSWLVRGVGHIFRGRGGLVRYVNLEGTTSRTWQDVLCAVSGDRQTQPADDEPLPAELFARFRNGIHAARMGNPLPDVAPTGPLPDLVDPIGAPNERTLDHRAALLDEFRAALERWAKEAPNKRLLLILDQFEYVSSTDLPVLIRGLLLPIAQGQVPGVQLLVAQRPDAHERLRQHGLSTLSQTVVVTTPATSDRGRLAAAYRDLETAAEETKLRDLYDRILAAFQDDQWRLSVLSRSLSLSREALEPS